MAYRDMNGNITINENAANADIKRLCAAKQYLVDSENAINSLIKQAADGQGETATAVVEKPMSLKCRLKSSFPLSKTQRIISAAP